MSTPVLRSPELAPRPVQPKSWHDINYQLLWTGKKVSHKIMRRGPFARRMPLAFVQQPGEITNADGLRAIHAFTEDSSDFPNPWEGHCVKLGALVGLAYAKRLASPPIYDVINGAVSLPEPTVIESIKKILRNPQHNAYSTVAAHNNNSFAGRAFDSLSKPIKQPISCGRDGAKTSKANQLFGLGFKFAVSDTVTDLVQHFYQEESVRNPMAANCINGDISYFEQYGSQIKPDDIPTPQAE